MPRGVPTTGKRRTARRLVRPHRREAHRPFWPGEERPRWELTLHATAERHPLPPMRLLAATLVQAIRDVTQGNDAIDAFMAMRWIESDARQEAFHFAAICDALDLPEGDIRDRVRRWFVARWVMAPVTP